MKAQLIATALIASVTSTFAADSWLTNLEDAQKKSAAENKPILIEFTGSDWCPPCKMLQKNVFSTETFNSKAPEKFILVEMDYPRNKEGLTQEVQDYRQSIAQKYEIKGFPSIILTDATGKPLGRTGYMSGDADAYLAHLDELLAESNKEKTAFKEAHKLEGKAKAEALVKLLENKPAGELTSYFKSDIEALKAADPQDELGFIKKQNDQAEFDKLMGNIEALAAADKWSEVEGAIDTYLQREKLPVGLQQEALTFKAQVKFFKQQDKETALSLLDQVIKLDDSSQVARKAKQIKAHIESK